jgi:hypothetical protein
LGSRGDEHLEHRRAFEIDELSRAGAPAEERPIHKIDRRPAIPADVAVERAVAVDVEIAATTAPGGNSALVPNANSRPTMTPATASVSEVVALEDVA